MLYIKESLLDTIPIRNILFLFAYLIIFLSSEVLPELLKTIRISFFEIIPRSPCDASLADILNEAVPTDAKVAAIFDPINPLFPTPHKIILDWHLEFFFTA